MASSSNANLSPAFMVLCRLIHGGAWDIPPELHEAHARGQDPIVVVVLFVSSNCLPHICRCAAAHTAACAARAAGADGLSIVIAALDVLEEDWTFDAGTGPRIPVSITVLFSSRLSSQDGEVF